MKTRAMATRGDERAQAVRWRPAATAWQPPSSPSSMSMRDSATTQFPAFLPLARSRAPQGARQRVLRRCGELLLGRRAEPEGARQRLDALGAPEVGALGLEDGDVAARLVDGALLLGDARLELPGVVVAAVEDEGAGDREDQRPENDQPHRALQPSASSPPPRAPRARPRRAASSAPQCAPPPANVPIWRAGLPRVLLSKVLTDAS